MKIFCKNISFTFFAAVLFFSCSGKKQEMKKPPVKIEAACVEMTTIPIFLEGIGHVRAYNHAEIKARVEGVLFHVHYKQGDMVEEGASLMTIDPRPYEAKLKQAEGDYIKYNAELKFAQDKAYRYSKLVDESYVSQLNFDEYVSNVNALIGMVKKAQGEIEDAKLNVEYCLVKAPFTGRVGLRLVDEGNLITNDGATLITLNQIQPIFVDFSLPEKDLLKIQKKQQEGNLKVKIKVEDVEEFDELGDLIVIGNDIDVQTGMIPLRALFENKKSLLWHGQFVKAKLILELKKNAILVPEQALCLGQKGFYVFVVDQGNIVKKIDVTVGERIAGLVEVTSGLKAKEIVVTNGQINLKTGSEVEVKSIDKSILKRLKEF